MITRSKISNIPRLNKNVILHICIVLTVGLLAYSNSLTGPFVFDDLPSIVDNPVIRDLSMFTDIQELSKNVGQTGAVQHAIRTRYISYLSFALNYRLHGLETFGYHLVNLLIHIGNALLVYLLGCQLWRLIRTDRGQTLDQVPLQGYWAALVASLLFVSHPLQTQAVSSIVQRMTSLTTFFLLLAMVCYLGALLSERIKARYLLLGGALICGLMGALSKEFAILLPGLLIGVELLHKRSSKLNKVGRLLLMLPVSLLPPVMLFGFNSAGSSEMGKSLDVITSGPTLSSLEYFYTQLRVVPRYLQLLVWPVGQNVDHDVPLASSFWESGVWSGGLLIILLLMLLVWLTLRPLKGVCLRLIVMTGWAFWLTLLPESSFFPIADVMFEHRMYFPMVWLSLSAGFLLFWVSTEIVPQQGKKISALIALLVLLLAGMTWERNLVWADSERLWRDVVAKSPVKARPYNNLGKVLKDQKRLEEAIPFFLIATKLEPLRAQYRSNYALTLQEAGRSKLAIEEYQAALHIDPNQKQSHYNLAVLSIKSGNSSIAENSLRAFLRLTQRSMETESDRRFEASHLLANLLRDQKRYNEANFYYKSALRIDSDLPQLNNDYGIALADQGLYPEAEAFLSRAASSPGCSSEANNNLGSLLLMLKQIDQARIAFQKAIICDPTNAQALSNLNYVNSQ